MKHIRARNLSNFVSEMMMYNEHDAAAGDDDFGSDVNNFFSRLDALSIDILSVG